MRVPTITTYSTSTYRLGNLTNDLKNANEVVSTQKRINEISDDPIGMSQVLSLKSTVKHLDQIKQNVVMGKSWLESGENAMDSVNRLILDVKTEAGRLVNASMSADERKDAIQMVDHAIDQIMTLGNTQLNGNYIFSGTDTDTEPLAFSRDGTEEKVVYNGNNSPFSVRTDRNSGVEVGRDGRETFWETEVQINSTNNTVVFKEDNGHGSASEKIIHTEIPQGTYTKETLELEVENALNKASAEKGYGAVYKVDYNEAEKAFSIREDGTYEGYLRTEFMWDTGGDPYVNNIRTSELIDPDDVNLKVVNKDALTKETTDEPFKLIWDGDSGWDVEGNPGYVLPSKLSGTSDKIGIDLDENGKADIKIQLDEKVLQEGESIEFDMVPFKGDHSTGNEMGFNENDMIYEPPVSDTKAEYITDIVITTSGNNTISFEEINSTGGASVLTANFNTSAGSTTYTDMDVLAGDIESAMESESSASGNTIDYAVTYDPENSRFNIREDGSELNELNIQWNASTAAAETLGYYPMEDTISYPKSDNTPIDGSFTINDTNNKIDFEETNTAGVATTLTATVTPGEYKDMATFEAAVETAMNDASAGFGNNVNYDVAYDDVADQFAIQRTSGTTLTDFDILWATGSNWDRSIGRTLGYDISFDDDTGPVHTSDTAPDLMTFDSTNNVIDFREVGLDGSVSDEISIEITKTGYTDLDDVASEIEAALQEASPNNVDYAVSYDDTVGQFMIKGSDASIKGFDLLWNTGTNSGTSAADMLGFDTAEDDSVRFSESDESVANLTVNDSNNKIDFMEIPHDNDGSCEVCELTASVGNKTYTSHEELAEEVEKALEKESYQNGNQIDYSVSWDDYTKHFTIKENGTELSEFRLQWQSGDNAPVSRGGSGESIGPLLGFEAEDDIHNPVKSPREAEWGIFNTLIDLKQHLSDNDTQGIERTLGRLDFHYDNMTQRIVDSGMKYNRLQVRETVTEEVDLSLTERRSSIEDADIIESIMKLKNIETAYQAALNSTSRIMNLSLVDYLR
jgi:flagellar hook-associated protein 3 FlgL